MCLNLHFYPELGRELKNAFKKNEELMTKFVLAGKEPYFAVENAIDKPNMVEIYDRPDSSLISFHGLYLQFCPDVWVDIYNEHRCKTLIVERALCSVWQIKINTIDPFPAVFTDLLLKNPNFKILWLRKCDFATAKLLVESRQFDYLHIQSGILGSLSHVCIDTESLYFLDVSLEEILKTESIKTESLDLFYENEEFSDSLLMMNIGSGFESLKELKLTVLNMNIFLNFERFLKFLELVNTQLVNLEFLELSSDRDSDEFVNNKKKMNFVMIRNLLEAVVNFKNNLVDYDDRVTVEIKHFIKFEITSNIFEENTEDYFEELQKEFSDLNCYSNNAGKAIYYIFECEEISEKLTLEFALTLKCIL